MFTDFHILDYSYCRFLISEICGVLGSAGVSAELADSIFTA
jgi:hypothetical protein